MVSFFIMVAVAATQPQPNCKGPKTQLEMNFCSGEAYKAADAAMGRQYKILAAQTKKIDGGKPDFFPALLASQRAWLKYRDAQCRLEGYRTRGGTAEPMNVNGCLEELTKARTEELKSLSEVFGN